MDGWTFINDRRVVTNSVSVDVIVLSGVYPLVAIMK